MSSQDRSLEGLLQRRLDLVANLSALTAQQHKRIQEMSALEMDVLRLELELARDPGKDELVRELHDIDDRAAAMRSSQAECLEATEMAEAEVEAIDRLIAAARGGYS